MTASAAPPPEAKSSCRRACWCQRVIWWGISKRDDERTRTADLLITSLLAGVLVRPDASGNCACLGGFRRSGGITLSVACQCVSARLQYGLQYMGGRRFVLGMRFPASATPGRGEAPARRPRACHHPSQICSKVGSGASTVGAFGERPQQCAGKAQEVERVARRVEAVPAPP